MSDTPLMDAALRGYKLDPAQWKKLRPLPRKLFRRGREIEHRMYKAERANAELVEAIENAPHSLGCASKDFPPEYMQRDPNPCNCWKSAALARARGEG